MTTAVKKFSALLILTTSGTLLLGGTAHAMDFNDDADLDTSAVRDLSGCTNPDPEICDWNDAKYQRAQEANEKFGREEERKHPKHH